LRLPNYVYCQKEKERELSLIQTCSMNGGEIFSIVKILAEAPIFGTLLQIDREMVVSFIKLVSVTVDLADIEFESFAERSELVSLVVNNFQKKFVASFRDAVPEDKNLLTRPFVQFNLSFPNFSSLSSLANQIEFHNSLDVADTSRVCLNRFLVLSLLIE
jgi:hypothetical protein